MKYTKQRFDKVRFFRGGNKTKGLEDLCFHINEIFKNENQRIKKICIAGVYSGESTQIINEILKPKDLCACIDNWKADNLENYFGLDLNEEMINSELNFNEIMKRYKNIIKYKCNVLDKAIVEKIPDKYFDFIFIDTVIKEKEFYNHLKVLYKKLRYNGFIGGSNFFELGHIITKCLGQIEKIFIDGSWLKRVTTNDQCRAIK